MSQLFTSGCQSIGTSASALVLPANIQGWFPLGLTGLISLSKGLFRVFFSIMIYQNGHQSKDITLLTKVDAVKATVFPVVIKQVEHWKIDAFELWCWRRLLRVPWIARRSSQSILKEISPEHSLEGLMMKLKLQYFGHLMRRTDSLEKTLMLGKTEGRRRRGRQRIRCFLICYLGWSWRRQWHPTPVLLPGKSRG